MITPTQKEALQYVKNTNGRATRDDFIDDHDPIGDLLWEDLWHRGTILLDSNGKVRLTSEGKQLLNT